MDCRTGDVFRGQALEDEFRKRMFEGKEPLEPVPNEFAEEVDTLLGDSDIGKVDLTQDTPLTRWANSVAAARSKNERPKMKKKSKMAKQSRKRNR